MSDKTVSILLSTYNGESYLTQLLDSILSQSYNNIKILIRDDGSKDSTLNIIKSYIDKYSNIIFIKGDNVGPAQSFFELLKNAPDADYYAFADQDDVWLPDKIKRGVEMLESNHANLYHSNYQLTDSNLNTLPTEAKPLVDNIYHAAILYPCTGCTMIISKKLRDMVLSYSPKFMVMHDIWIFKIAMAVCRPVVFDSNSYIMYRQHGNNVIGGIKSCFWQILKGRIKSLLNPPRTRSKEMNELLNGFSNYMDDDTLEIVNGLAKYYDYSFAKRLKIAFDKKFNTSVKSKNTLFKLAIILKNY